LPGSSSPSSTFIVALGHEEPSIEDVVVSHGGFSVVVKRGEAAEVAAGFT
jgi:hypothetical protein